MRTPKGGQKETQGGPGEATRGQDRKKEASASPLLHHFGTQNPTNIVPKSLKNGFENKAEYKYVFSLVLEPKTFPKPLPKPPKNHQKSNEKKGLIFNPLFKENLIIFS